MLYNYFKSPIGILEICVDNNFLLGLNYVSDSNFQLLSNDEISDKDPLVVEVKTQLEEYFNGSRINFDIPIALEGTSFQMSVWNALKSIPYGETASYKDIAEKINNPKAVRAVGGANNKNKISIIIPCHRVIGANGKLVGYGGGLDKKEWLLEHESKNFG